MKIDGNNETVTIAQIEHQGEGWWHLTDVESGIVTDKVRDNLSPHGTNAIKYLSKIARKRGYFLRVVRSRTRTGQPVT